LPVDVAVPEDRVADEAVVGAAGKQAAELAFGAGAVEAPPDDRVKAGVPIPLPRVVERARSRVPEVASAALAINPVAAQRLLDDSEDSIADAAFEDGFRAHAVMRRMPRNAITVNSAPSPSRARRPGQVFPQVTDPMKPWRAASTTCVTGLIRATVCSDPWSRCSVAYAVVKSTRMNIPACISGAADCVRNRSAREVPQVAATIAIPITTTS